MKEINLPDCWEKVTLQQFQLLTNIPINEDGEIFNGVDNIIGIVNKLTGISIEELEGLAMKEVIKFGEQLSFIIHPPIPNKTSTIKWKTIDEITFNDYILVIKFDDKLLENLHVIIKNYSHTTLSEEQILQLPITDVYSGFFLFSKQTKKYINRSIRSTKIKLIKLKIKHLFKSIMKT